MPGEPTKWIRAAAKLFSERGNEPPPLPPATNASFELREQFLSSQEDTLFRRLEAALREQAIICPKTRVFDVIRLCHAAQRLEEAVRLDRKFIDFLICQRDSRRPVCAVQIDRWMEESGNYSLRDEFLEHALRSAGLAIFHVRSEQLPSVDLIGAKILPLLQRQAEQPRGGDSRPGGGLGRSGQSPDRVARETVGETDS